jgi:hypothetical protein
MAKLSYNLAMNINGTEVLDKYIVDLQRLKVA